MTEYKCIMCGETDENQKIHNCPVCGYRMFQTPYEKNVILRKEIQDFLLKLCEISVRNKELCFVRENQKSSKKEKISIKSDQMRFPSFEKIFSYAVIARKTEEFLDRLTSSFEHIKEYIQTPFAMEYAVITENAEESIQERSQELKELLKIISIEYNPDEIKLPVIKLKYSEVPDENIEKYVSEIFSLSDQLLLKIRKFIKQNHVFGAFYTKTNSDKYKVKTQGIPLQLKKQTDAMQRTLNKKYVVDLLSDGSEEICEMLDVLWKSIALLTKLPVLKQEYHFSSDSFTCDGIKELTGILTEIARRNYDSIKGMLSDEAFLLEHDEKSLFKTYNEMIAHDSIGYFGMRSSMILNVGEHEEKLNAMIGLDLVKTSIQKIKAYSLANKGNSNLNLHMCFYGNPGTGKTEVARIIAGILHENGILPINKVIETDRSGLVAAYVGQTALKTLEMVEKAMGGVLFIDEAYSLVQSESGGDYGHEAVAALIKAMEDHRGKFCVILAGYRNQMKDMIASNPGFQSRIQFELDFQNYSREELRSIAELMLLKMKYTMSERAMDRILDITDVLRKNENFANAREMRNILEQVVMCQNLRCAGTKDKMLEIVDVNRYIKDSGLTLPVSSQSSILTNEERLEQLVGLASVKRMVKKIKAYAKRNQSSDDFNMHMCFYGNPGTGKTEVARIISGLLYDAGVLPEAKLVETDASGLIGKYVGETAPKTQAKINDAMGGVLFIDEAYALTETSGADGVSSGYGDEAISVLLKEMEDKRGKFCVILAGYKEQMQKLLSSNPGFASRIQFSLDFPDYSREELMQLADVFLSKKQYEIDSDAMEKLLDVTEYFRQNDDFANARTLRNILDQVIMNQNLRAEDDEEDRTIILSDVEDYLFDERIELEKKSAKGRIGFV